MDRKARPVEDCIQRDTGHEPTSGEDVMRDADGPGLQVELKGYDEVPIDDVIAHIERGAGVDGQDS